MSGIWTGPAEEVIQACKDAASTGLVSGTWGNASVRVSEDEIMITPTGMDYEGLKPADMVIVSPSGAVKRSNRRPSTEMAVHLEIYRRRPDVGAIMHTHSVYAGVLAVTRTELPVLLEEQAQFVGGPVSVAEYAPAGSPELARSATSALGRGGGVFLANHGLVGVGKSPGEALLICRIIEKACQVFILSLTLGRPIPLEEEETARLRKTFLENYGQR